jgi:hypothetical protein
MQWLVEVELRWPVSQARVVTAKTEQEARQIVEELLEAELEEFKLQVLYVVTRIE